MDIHTLNDKEKLFGYNDIVLYFELQVKNTPQGFNYNRLHNYLAAHQITIKEEKDIINSPFMQDFQQNPVSFFCFKPAYRNSVRYSTLAALLYHLRNSFAHALVEITIIGRQQYYCFKDISPSSNKKQGANPQITMIGQIPKSLFVNFIDEIKANRKNKNQTNQINK